MKKQENVKFVARQAILDRNESLFAYELLYRDSSNNAFPANVSDDAATARLFFDSLLFFGIDKLANNKKLFINLSTNSILADLPKIIGPKNVVFEIIERTNKLEQVKQRVEQLIKQHYVFALDDYNGDPKWDNLLQQMKYIKIEVEQDLAHTLNRITTLKAKFPDKYIIVERIEDHQTFELIKNAGADFFQGYYFMKPKLLNFKNVNHSQLTALSLLNLVLKTPVDFASLIKQVEKDAAIVARLLRLSNLRCKSAHKKIHSISQAIIYLGEDTIKQFIVALSLGDLGENKPCELLKIGLIRARFMQLLLQRNQKQSDMGYLLGIASIFTALIDVDLTFIFKEFSLNSDIKNALKDQSGTFGQYLTLCLKIENSDFIAIDSIQKRMSLDNTFMMQCYTQALTFADEAAIY